MYQPNVFGWDNSKNNVFHFQICDAKNTEMDAFDNHAPETKCVQDYDNTCCLSSIDSSLFAANENVAEHDVISLFSSSLSC